MINSKEHSFTITLGPMPRKSAIEGATMKKNSENLEYSPLFNITIFFSYFIMR